MKKLEIFSKYSTTCPPFLQLSIVQVAATCPRHGGQQTECPDAAPLREGTPAVDEEVG